MTGHFLAAERLLLHPLPGSHTPLLGPSSSMGEATGILGKGKAKETLAGEVAGGRLADRSLACRYLAAQCLVRGTKSYFSRLFPHHETNRWLPQTGPSSSQPSLKLTSRSSGNITKTPSSFSANQIHSVRKHLRLLDQARQTVVSSYTPLYATSAVSSTYGYLPSWMPKNRSWRLSLWT